MDYCEELLIVLRILLAMACGFVIGIERKIRLKEAGMRTHALVAVGACLFMLVSKYGFEDSKNFDASRVAAQVVSGISFLGAGIILYKQEVLQGLTTAAGVWATAGVGMAVGSGLYIVGACATVIIVAVQLILHSQFRVFRSASAFLISVSFAVEDNNIEKIKDIFEIKKFLKLRIISEEGEQRCFVTLRSRDKNIEVKIPSIIKNNSYIKSIEIIEETT